MNFKIFGKEVSLKKGGIITGVFLFFLTYFLSGTTEMPPLAVLCAASAVMMATWWITEAVPLAATSLIPVAFFPLIGILKGDDVANSYINSTIFLFFGGFLIALAMEKWNLHKRIALKLVSIIGNSPSSVVLGFMVAGGMLSMWISNTAAAIMLLPTGLAIISQTKTNDESQNYKFAKALMLGIAYSCSIGGIATYVGTPPNLVFQRIFSQNFPNASPLLFGEWVIYFLPLSILMLFIVWVLLTKVLFKTDNNLKTDKKSVKQELAELGPIGYEERIILTVFSLTALLWIFRDTLNFGFISIPGWSNLFPVPKFIDDGTISVFMALLLFFIPAKSNKAERIIDNNILKNVPWDIILLFGGGFALADAFVKTGLSDFIGSQFYFVKDLPVILLILSIALGVTFLTELTSNTATAQIFLPVLASLAYANDINPFLLMIPATLSASMAFMLPVATPPNAVVFSSGKIKVKEMARAGLMLNLIGAVIITVWVYLIFEIIRG